MRAELPQEQLKRIKARLLRERRAILAKHATQSPAIGAADMAGTAEPGLLASVTIERDQAFWAQERTRALLSQVDAALARLEDGSYGLCERCGRRIDPARLEAIPYTVSCIEHARGGRTAG